MQEKIEKIKKNEFFTNSIGMKFRYIKPGTFMMGSPDDEPDRNSDEILHKVTLTKGFYMQTTQVTQEHWKEIMGNNPSKFKGVNLSVEQVSWDDVQSFITRLNRKEDANKYRLPTEAEWEYACRAGSDTRYCFGNNEDKLWNYAWYDYNGDSKTHPVGKKQPNAWGLYDMHRNVWEWCEDWYGDYPAGDVTDPKGPPNSSDCVNRVNRGGCWRDDAGGCRSAVRGGGSPGTRLDCLGFRLACSAGH